MVENAHASSGISGVHEIRYMNEESKMTPMLLEIVLLSYLTLVPYYCG